MNAPAPPPTDSAPFQPAAVLAGKYRVDRVLGRGAASAVVEARPVGHDERVAIKLLLSDHARQPEVAAALVREAQAAAKLEGEHVARVSDAGALENGAPYVVMELLEGTDLARAIERHGVFRVPEAVDYVLQACEAIIEAHAQGIVHGDLRPANLFLARRPAGPPMIKVLDFGISKASGGADSLTHTAATMGSALYMSPEQMQQARAVDHRTDIYGLGIILYELLAGEPPFHADTLPQLCAAILTGTPTPIRSLRADVPEGLPEALEQAYARDREQRHPTIADLAAALAPFAPTRSQTSLDRIARIAGQPPAVAGAGAPASSQPDLAPRATGRARGAASQALPPVHLEVEIPISGYIGPMSHKAAAAFAAGPNRGESVPPTGGSMSLAGKVGIVVVVAILLGLAIGGVAYFYLRASGGSDHAAPPAGSSAISPPPPRAF